MNEKINPLSGFQDLTIRDYYFLLSIHAKKIIIFSLLGLLASIYQLFTTPPSYTATATIVVREKPGANVIMDLTGDRERNRIENELQLIRSRSVAKVAIEKLWSIKKNNLDLFGSYPFYPRGKRIRTYFKEIVSLGLYDPKQNAPNFYTENYSDEIGERFASTLISRINLNPRINSDIIDVSYTSVWPEEAKLIINTIVDTYKEFDQILSTENASSSVAFLKNLVEDQEAALFLSER